MEIYPSKCEVISEEGDDVLSKKDILLYKEERDTFRYNIFKITCIDFELTNLIPETEAEINLKNRKFEFKM